MPSGHHKPPSKPPRETVILLHGIGHSRLNMIGVEKALAKACFKTLNLTYPSRKHRIEELSDWLAEQRSVRRVWQDADKIHFVGHSMGGLIIGAYLDRQKRSIPAGKMGRVVMLGTPHGGSEVADFLRDNPLYRWVFGPAGQELTTKARRDHKITPWYELGIIAGTQNWLYPIGLYAIEGDHDGCVSVESTKLDNMKDHITLPVLHGFMGFSGPVTKQIVSFLKTGTFEKQDSIIRGPD